MINLSHKPLIKQWFAVMFLALFPLSSNCMAKVIIDLTDPGLNKIPLAIPDFMDQDDGKYSGQKPARIIRNDLELSGMFTIIDSDPIAGANGYEAPNLEKWAALGAQGLLVGRLRKQGAGVELEAKFYDTGAKKMILGKRLQGEYRDLRRMAHHISDRIMETLTGVPGCFNTKIAFVSAGPMREIHLIDYDGENMFQITNNRSINMSPEWSSDGRSILFTSYVSSDPDLWSVNLSNLKTKSVSHRRGLDASARFAPDGRAIALSLSFKGIPNIFIISPQGNILKQLTNSRGNDISPAWSPDGSKIVYVSDRAGGPNIYVKPSTGGRAKRLTFETSYNTDPDWSPQGNQIAFTGRIDGSFQIFVMRSDGSDVRALTHKGSNRAPAWSPDGRMIAFFSDRDGEDRIYVMDSRGDVQKRVSPIPGKSPAWSPYLGQ